MNCFLVPEIFFVGDEVKLYCLLPKKSFYNDSSFNIEKIEQNNFLEIKNISIVERKGESYLCVIFVPWEVGEIDFPSLKNIGVDYVLPKVIVSSVLEKEKIIELQDVRSPILLKGTTYLIYGYIALFISFVLILSFTIFWIKKKKFSFFNFIVKYHSLFVFYFSLVVLKRKLIVILKDERNKAILKEKNSWGKHYESALRKFLFSIHNIKNKLNWDALTYKEIESAISEDLRNEKELNDVIKLLFYVLGLIRFSNFDDVSFSKEQEILKHSFKLLKLYRKKKMI